MRLVVKAPESAAAKMVANAFYNEVGNIAAFSAVELVLGDKDEILVTEAHAKISVDMRNDFIQERDEKAVRFLTAQRIFIANVKKLGIGEPFIEEITANKMMARAGYGDSMVYYYYMLISRMKKNAGFEEFMFLNIPRLSLYGTDNYDAEFFLSLLSNFAYKKVYEDETRELFGILKGGMKGADVSKAARIYRGLYARNQI